MMNPVDIGKLEELLESENFAEAKILLQSYLASDISKEAKGEAYMAFIMTYTRVMNRLNELYERALTDAITTLDAVHASEKTVTDKIKMAQLKKDIGQLKEA